MKFRHRIVRNVACAILKPYSILKYGIKVEKFKEQGKGPYLILLNHQTPFDQFFCGMSFKGPVYYVATEDIFSNGITSALIKYLVAPIPIRKQATDMGAVLNCIRVAREGGTICIAPEGNRTYSGKTEYMSPTIASLAKRLKMPIVIYLIQGGYGAQPRWSDVVRKGKMRSYVSRVINPEEYSNMSDDELYQLIKTELYVNEGTADAVFKHKKRAEYLERAMYVCPKCGFSKFYSKGAYTQCETCGIKLEYTELKELKCENGDFPFEFINDWYDYQCDFVNSVDTLSYTDKPIFTDKAAMSEVIVYKKKIKLRKSSVLSLYGDRIVVDENTDNEMIFDFNDVTAISVLGRNKLNVYFDKKVYQFKGDKHFNALKYVNICYRHKNILKGDENGKFLGL